MTVVVAAAVVVVVVVVVVVAAAAAAAVAAAEDHNVYAPISDQNTTCHTFAHCTYQKISLSQKHEFNRWETQQHKQG
jgi:hypothetical protein